MCGTGREALDGGGLLTPEQQANLRNYKYHGRDLSLTYKYFLSPLAEKCLIFVPKWMAPNLVTLLGLGVSFIGYLLLYTYCYDFTSHDAPRWVLPVVGAGLFIYQTLDNMDGKHARRTGSGSPLGLLFDHGCDAINCTLGTFVFATAIGVGRSLPLVAMCFANQAVPFFWATWEEYHIGEMNLPIINGPSEGMLIGVALTVGNYFTGPDFWWTPLDALFGYAPAAAILAASMIGIATTALIQTATVLAHVAKKSDGGGAAAAARALWGLSGFAASAALSAAWLSRAPAAFDAHPHAVVFLVGAVNVDLLVSLMLAHIVGAPHAPLRRAPLAALAALAAARAQSPAAVLGAAAAMAAHVALMLTRTVRAVRDALGIYVFSLEKRRMD